MTTEKYYYVYILKCNDETLYTGWTTDVKRRFQQHNTGKGAKYTRIRTPLSLAYVEQFLTKVEACQREYAIKQLSRTQKLALIQNGTTHTIAITFFYHETGIK